MNEITSVSLKGNRESVFESISKYLAEEGFTIAAKDFTRPWGGFFVLDENQAEKFAKKFFGEVDFKSLKISNKLSPKILVVEPHKRLSWQYHHRRAEIWKLVAGTSGVVISKTDDQGDVQQMKPGEIVRLAQGQRHRLVGRDGWGMVAEIWQHTDAQNPSDENDIVRLQDDFGR
ncbi:MAG: phosphoheptose isomerase [Cyclobacteriaceae bacterium]|nr:phosphoheptose isomerase [Cyclobacteriaceae bacterium]